MNQSKFWFLILFKPNFYTIFDKQNICNVWPNLNLRISNLIYRADIAKEKFYKLHEALVKNMENE